MKGIQVSDFIRPYSQQDSYPTHYDIYGLGGLQGVATLNERDTITKARRKSGMLAFVEEDHTLYGLLGSLENTGWTKIFDFKDNQLNFGIFCDQGYVLIGNKNKIARPSPILIDIRQDIIDLKRKIGNFEELKKLDHNRIWIGDYYNEPEERLQIGVINLPPLAEAVFPNPIAPITGDFRIPNPTFDYLSPFDWVMSGPFLPQVFATKYDTLGNPIGTGASSSLAMTYIRAAQIMKRFDNANFIVGCSTVTFGWENPKMYLIPEILKQLYGLGTTYTFTKAQSLGNLQTGLLKNKVDNTTASGTLSTAIAGKDYVDVADAVADMKLVLIRPLQQDEEGNDIAKLLTRVDRLPADNMPNLTTGKYWKGGANNIPIEVDIPTYAPTDATYILQRPNVNLPQAQALSSIAGLLGGILKCNSLGVVSIASGGSVPLSDDYVTPTNLADEKTERIGADSAIKTALVALEAEVEAEIAALAGVQAISILGTILGFIGVAVGGKAYGDYIRGQLLNVKNKWTSADLNDEGHNAVGDYEFRFPSGYSSDDRGFSTLWFDSDGRSSNHKSEGGLRLFSWDSGGDHIGSDSPIAPLHIGLFGYQNKYHIWPFPNPTAKYKGFIFSIPDFHNESSSDDYYRFPKRFGLYDVTRTIGTWTSNKYGWDSKETIFEYDYNNFNFYKKVVLKEYTNFEKEADFQKNVRFLGTGAVKIPVGTSTDRPTLLNSQIGMLRINTDDLLPTDLLGINILGTSDQINVVSNVDNFTISLAENVKLPGKQYTKIAVGNLSERPSVGEAGMIRYNTEN